MCKDEIIRILKESKEELDSIVSVPIQNEGFSLHLKRSRGRTEFYAYDERTGRQTYIKPTDKETIRGLSSGYCEKKIKAAAKLERGQLEECLAILEKDKGKTDVTKVLQTIPDIIKENAVLSELSVEGYASRWQESNSVVKKRKTHREDDYHTQKTLRGDYVGSKSELMIADRLFQLGIPYHYEVAFTPEARVDHERPVYDEFGRIAGYETLGFSPFDSDTLHPDFYVLNKRTRKAYFWEHLGAMDNAEYCRKNFNRFVRILDAGFVIGQDLIVTHEDSRHPLTTEMIDAIIEKYLK